MIRGLIMADSEGYAHNLLMWRYDLYTFTVKVEKRGRDTVIVIPAGFVKAAPWLRVGRKVQAGVSWIREKK